MSWQAGKWAVRMLAGLCILVQPAGARTIYVATNGTDVTGNDWSTPTSLTNALVICTSSDEIWLEQGTYTNSATFTVPADRKVYGGFTNGMGLLTERDWTNYPAILDGMAQNRRVVTVSGTNVTLDGLVITNSTGGGIIKSSSGLLVLANVRLTGHVASRYDGHGGYFSSGSVLMTNCVVDGNSCTSWGNSGLGIYSSGAGLEVVDCLFSNNTASANNAIYGGALYFDNGALRVRRTDFINNSGGPDWAPGGGGGAVYVGSAAGVTAVFSNCVFRGNRVRTFDANEKGFGGAMYFKLNSAVTASVVNCTFAANTNQAYNSYGGAIHLSNGTLNVKNCILWTNRVSGAGSKAHEVSRSGGTLNMSYSLITGTTTPYTDGTISFLSCGSADPQFAGPADLHLKSVAGRWENGSWVNDAVYSPGIDAGDPEDGVGSESAENGSRVNLGAYGGTVQASRSPTPAAPLVANRSPVTNNYTQMILRGELTNPGAVMATVGICYGTNSISEPTTNGWEYVCQFYPPRQTGEVFSVTTSFLVTNMTYYYRAYATNGYGTNWAAVESFVTDTEYPPGWDVGGGADVIHVKPDAVGEADGRDWFNAFTTIASGIDALGGTRTNIWITGGIFKEGVQLAVATDAMILGGFTGTESAVAERTLTNALGVVTNYTVLDGNASYKCLAVTAGNVWMECVTVSNVNLGNAVVKSGSGTFTMDNCRVVKNSGGAYGVGCAFSGGSVVLTNCVVADNALNAHSRSGIGIYSSGAALTLIDCVVSNNTSSHNATSGGGLYFDNGALRIRGCEFIGNTAKAENGPPGGGGIYLGGSAGVTVSISNSVFRANLIPVEPFAGVRACGAAMMAALHASVTASVVNCSFVANTNLTATGAGGAIYLSSGTMNLKNCILWTNRCTGASGTGHELFVTNAGSQVTMAYSCLTETNDPHVVAVGGATVTWGQGIMSADPLFASSTDLHLKSRAGRWDPVAMEWVYDRDPSPCIDAGDRADSVGLESQPNGNRINMGAYGGTWQASRTLLSGMVLIIR